MKTYRIGELGRRFGLSRSTLLYYDRIGLLTPSARSDAEYRLYTANDLARLERICLYREAGLALAEIARLLGSVGDDGVLLEKRLRAIGRELAALKSQQRLVAGMLKTVAAGGAASGLDRELWLSLQKACGVDGDALERWHREFERRAPAAHHGFLLGLGLSEKEAIQVRMLTRNMEDNTMQMQYFFEVFEELPRQGPGCRAATLRALAALKDLPAQPQVLDVGCGSGMQTLILAEQLKTRIVAVDNHRPVLDRLQRSAAERGLQIETRELSMIDLPIAAASLDLIWAEGSLFIIGVERGFKDFRALLKPGGYLACSEMCWFASEPPAEAKAYFDEVYPAMRGIDEVRRIAVASGYRVVDCFKLPDSAWWDDYYTPMLERIKALRARNSGLAEAQLVYANCEAEVEMFRRHSPSYGYAFFVLQRD